MAFDLAQYMTEDTLVFYQRVSRSGYREDLSRLWDKGDDLPFSPLVYEFDNACQGSKQREKWLQSCLDEAAHVIFDIEGKLKKSIRAKFRDLSGLDNEGLDSLLYGEESLDS